MSPTKIASVAALVGGVGWLAKVALIWWNGGTNTDEGLVAVTYFVGLGGLALALAAAGYSLVSTAPIWLRAVVSVALTLLVFMVWQLVDDAIKALYTKEGWLRDEINTVLAAVIAVLLSYVGMKRAGAKQSDPPRAGGHRLNR